MKKDFLSLLKILAITAGSVSLELLKRKLEPKEEAVLKQDLSRRIAE